MNEQMNCWANLCANHPLRVGPFLVWANFGSKPNVGLLIPHLPPQTTGGHLLYMETDGQQGREMKLHPLHIFCTILQTLKSLHFYKIKHLWKVVFFAIFAYFTLPISGGGGNYTGKLLYSQTNGSCKLHGFGQFYTKSRCKMKYQCVQTGQSNHVTLQVCTTPSFGVHFLCIFWLFGHFFQKLYKTLFFF